MVWRSKLSNLIVIIAVIYILSELKKFEMIHLILLLRRSVLKFLKDNWIVREDKLINKFF